MILFWQVIAVWRSFFQFYGNIKLRKIFPSLNKYYESNEEKYFKDAVLDKEPLNRDQLELSKAISITTHPWI